MSVSQSSGFAGVETIHPSIHHGLIERGQVRVDRQAATSLERKWVGQTDWAGDRCLPQQELEQISPSPLFCHLVLTNNIGLDNDVYT